MTKPIKVTRVLFEQIMRDRRPLGKFYRISEDGEALGCDNSTGEAFVEEFENQGECLAWLEFDDNEEEEEEEGGPEIYTHSELEADIRVMKRRIRQLEEALRMGIEMRAGQKTYFRTRTGEALDLARSMERAFDKTASAVLDGEDAAEKLVVKGWGAMPETPISLFP